MAIDFPPNAVNPNPPSNGDTYVDSASGTEWEYNATNNSWTIVSSSAPGGGAFVYIGEHDFTQAAVPSPPADAGYVYSQSDIGNAPGNVNGVYTGIAGDTIIEGTLVLYTGSSWTFMSTTPGYPNLGDGNGDTLDTRYVRTQGDNVNVQVITGAAGLKTNGMLETGGGIEISGGNPDNIVNGIAYNDRLRFIVQDEEALAVRTVGNFGMNINQTVNSARTASDFTSCQTNVVIGDHGTKNVKNFRGKIDVTDATAKDVVLFETFATGNPTSIDTVTNFLASSSTAKGTINYGFRSELNDSADFNYFASGSSPNFFKGDTYIGGSVSRNTLELWKSTLTEEQLEQFEAGTLVAPANVATPGDGAFARAWYYDQQDEETQLALDSGELEYPTHLAAATFTDTFALGENTKINLTSSGNGTFSGFVRANAYQDLNGNPVRDAAAVETFQKLQVAVENATNFGELKAAMLVALEDYKNA